MLVFGGVLVQKTNQMYRNSARRVQVSPTVLDPNGTSKRILPYLPHDGSMGLVYTY